MKKIIPYVFVILFFVSCKKENALDCFRSNGEPVTVTRFPGEFDILLVADKFEVQVFQGLEYKVEVTAGKNIIKNIISRISKDTLILSNNNKCNFVRGYKQQITINVTLPYLQFVRNSGVGASRINENFVQDSLSVSVSNSGDVHVAGKFNTIKTSSNGNGDIYLNGNTKLLYVYTNGINYVNARGLAVSDYMFIHTATIGDCYVNVAGTKTFAYNIEKTGNIYYSGDPLAINNVSGPHAKGRAIKE